MRKILADTNFLLMQFEYAIDIASELQRISDGPITLLVASETMNEIKSISGKTGKKAAAARFVLQNLGKLKEKFPVEIIESSGKVDGWIIKYAQNNRICVATNDVPLRRRLLALGLPVIAMKGKSKLDFV